MLLFVVPDVDRPIGGIKQIYRHAQILQDHGIPACVLHEQKGFRCSWFGHRAPVAYRGAPRKTPRLLRREVKRMLRQELQGRPGPTRTFDPAIDRGREVLLPSADGRMKKHVLGDDDVIVLPEFVGAALNGAVREMPVAIFNQNPHGTFRSYAIDVEPGPTVYRAANLAGVVVVSEHSARYLRFAFPDLPIRRVVNGVDARLFHPGDVRKPRTLAYMPRKLASHVEQVLNLLAFRGTLEGWTLSPIAGMDEEAVAGCLRESSLFMSTSTQEGFGLPPLEAAMAGCYVVGYTGHAAKEYMDPSRCIPVQQDDVLELASSLERAIDEVTTRPDDIRRKTRELSSELSGRYSLERERETVLAAWTSVLERAAHA